MGDFPPFALVVDDGELEPCCDVLSRLELDWLRVSPSRVAPGLPWPLELLVSPLHAVPRLAEIPQEERGDATWLCVLDAAAKAPELDALRSAGVHFVVRRARDGTLDRELLRLLFMQLAYAGAERRGSLRLLCSHEVSYAVEGYRGRGRLLDLSTAACRILTAYSVPRGSELQLYLPLELDPQAPSAYPGRIVRSAPATTLDGRYMLHLTVAFQASRPLQSKLEYVVRALAANPLLAALGRPQREELTLDEQDRRRAARHGYAAPAGLTYLAAEAPRSVRGHDISAKGMHIEPNAELEIGQRVTLSLYRGPAQGPLQVDAIVQRNDGERGLWLAFEPVEPRLRSELKGILCDLPVIEELAQGADPKSRPIWMALIETDEAQGPKSSS